MHKILAGNIFFFLCQVSFGFDLEKLLPEKNSDVKEKNYLYHTEVKVHLGVQPLAVRSKLNLKPQLFAWHTVP
jgi:hypothetical protein